MCVLNVLLSVAEHNFPVSKALHLVHCRISMTCCWSMGAHVALFFLMCVLNVLLSVAEHDFPVSKALHLVHRRISMTCCWSMGAPVAAARSL